MRYGAGQETLPHLCGRYIGGMALPAGQTGEAPQPGTDGDGSFCLAPTRCLDHAGLQRVHKP